MSLLKKFVEAFADLAEVKDDKRVVTRFTEYAQTQNYPLVVYNYMEEKGIGKAPYFLYYTMARKFEKQAQFYSALDAFREGLKVSEAKDGLLEDLTQFKLRMKKRIDKEMGKKSESSSVRVKRKSAEKEDTDIAEV
eukprot:TRINITY_DN3016_c0_g1_i4.p5 TRINITY_DN3016_c0_g1~~TRINITY_DN3016_c0_g1_i4.p5  ORF type:complete len:136 (+),score=42.46 TRINITY_DN3016_c0_g1_i4:1956-2363(+)